MTLFILERVTPSLRGELSKWMIEVQAGVFVGKINKMIRELLWQKLMKRVKTGTATMIWRSPEREQGFELKTWQPKGYTPVDVEGVWLIFRSQQANP